MKIPAVFPCQKNNRTQKCFVGALQPIGNLGGGPLQDFSPTAVAFVTATGGTPTDKLTKISFSREAAHLMALMDFSASVPDAEAARLLVKASQK